jgi:hypothetical protein
MIKAIHTPGPWVLLGNRICTNRENEIAQIIRYGAWFGGGTPYGLENPIGDANAHLIAAAPDLLLALEALLADALQIGLADSDLSGVAIQAKEAINKARGKSL